MSSHIWPWVVFNLFVIAMLVLDLAVFHRRSHTIKMKEALAWCALWIGLAFAFNLGVYFTKGPDLALQFLTGYILEESLSIDNLFIFIQIFAYFRVPAQYQHKVLFWGILGVIVLRALFILGGITLIDRFHWIIYIFGAMLMVTGIKMAFQKEEEIQPDRNPVIRLFKKFMPVLPSYEDGKFFVKKNSQWFATPLFIVLLVIEMTDIVFAIDSIPAVLAVTADPFIVYTSNLFAVLGLRSLYFVVSEIMNLFYYLKYGLSVILIFIGTKMLMSHFVKIPIGLALAFIVLVLFISILASSIRLQRINNKKD